MLPQRGEFPAFLCDDGGVVAPDLVESLMPVMLLAGADPDLWRVSTCVVNTPALESARGARVGIPISQLADCATCDLWLTHDSVATALPGATTGGQDVATLLDVKIELARRIMTNCHMCSAACGVDRMVGRRGRCGLSAELAVGDYGGLYNEGPLVGAPTFGVFLQGCSLRCRFCYRPDDIDGDTNRQDDQSLSELLDEARSAGAQSWHFMGGNPDHSIYGILRALKEVQAALPVVWNSALVMSPDAMRLLRGVVDIWIADYKFGNDRCAWATARCRGYNHAVQTNLAALTGEAHVLVRHMKTAGHADCCTETIRNQVQERYPQFVFLEHECIDSRGMRRGSGAPASK